MTHFKNPQEGFTASTESVRMFLSRKNPLLILGLVLNSCTWDIFVSSCLNVDRLEGSNAIEPELIYGSLFTQFSLRFLGFL